MITKFLLYGISTGINRGAALLYLPLLTKTLSLSEFGLYSLVQIAIQVFIPIISFNGSAAIMREGAETPGKGFDLLQKFSLLTLLTGGFTAICSSFIIHSSYYWLFFTVAIGSVESLHVMVLAWMRALNKDWSYLIFIIVKSVGLLAVIIIANVKSWTLFSLLTGQCCWYVIIVLLYLLPVIAWKRGIEQSRSSLRRVLTYTLLLIPHGISQWIMSGADRFIIKGILNDEQVGIYSIGYTLAMVLMLLNSGIGLTLPQHLIQNYSEWKTGTTRRRFINLYSIAAVVAMTAILAFLEIDRQYFGMIGHYSPVLFFIITWVGAGLYLLGIYYFYSNYLFFHKKTGVLATQTLIAALTNVILTVTLVKIFGIAGAAIATFITYAVYLVLIIGAAVRVEPALRAFLLKDLRFVSLGILYIIGIGWAYMNLMS